MQYFAYPAVYVQYVDLMLPVSLLKQIHSL